MGGQTESQVSAQFTKKKTFQCNPVQEPVVKKTTTCAGWPKGETLRSLACKFDLDQSGRKSLQTHAKHGQTESQVTTSF